MQTHFHSPRHKTCSEKLIHSTSRTQLNTLKTEHREHTLISSSTLPPMHAPSSGQICVNQKHEPGLGYNLLISNKMGKFAMFDSRHLNQSRGQASLAGSRSGHSRPMLTMFLNTLTRIYGWHPNYGSSQRTREIPLLHCHVKSCYWWETKNHAFSNGQHSPTLMDLNWVSGIYACSLLGFGVCLGTKDMVFQYTPSFCTVFQYLGSTLLVLFLFFGSILFLSSCYFEFLFNILVLYPCILFFHSKKCLMFSWVFVLFQIAGI